MKYLLFLTLLIGVLKIISGWFPLSFKSGDTKRKINSLAVLESRDRRIQNQSKDQQRLEKQQALIASLVAALVVIMIIMLCTTYSK